MPITHTVDVNGISLHVFDDGAGRPVVFGHSLFFDSTMFDPQLRALAHDHRVVAIDARAHGRSGIPGDDWTLRDQANDHARVMQSLDIDQAVMVGHSMGGMAALHCAIDHPGRVQGLVLIDTSAEPERLYTRFKYRMLAVLAQLFGVLPPIRDQAAKVMFGATFRRMHPDRVRETMRPIVERDPKILARTLHPVTSRPSVVERLPEIRVPALIIVGDEDIATPPRNAQVMVERLPNARLVTLPETGHLAPIERPDETTQLIAEFLERIGW